MIIWSIDAGLKGCIVSIKVDSERMKVTHLYRMPVIPHPTKGVLKTKIDSVELTKELSTFPKPDYMIMELPNPMPNNGFIRISSLFQSLGIIEGCCSGFCDNINYVAPRKWKEAYNLINKNKRASNDAANQLFKDLDVRLVKDADISEAALVGHWFIKYSGVIN